MPPLAGLSAFELHALAKLARPCTVTEGQLCLASIPTAWPHAKRHDEPGGNALPSAGLGLGALPYERDQVYIIRTGEARLLTSLAEPAATARNRDGHGDDAQGAAALGAAVAVGTGARGSSQARALELALGRTAPLATLGPSEVISADLLSGDTLAEPEAPWCLQPRGVQLELLVFPRREWDAAIRNSAKTTLRDLAAQRAYFFQTRLHDARREQASRLHVSSRNLLHHALGGKDGATKCAPGGRVGPGGGAKSSRALLCHEIDVEGGGGGVGGEAMAMASMPRSKTLPQLGRRSKRHGEPPRPPRPGTPTQQGLYRADVMADVTTRSEQLRAQLEAERTWRAQQQLLQLHQPRMALATNTLPAIRPAGGGIVGETPTQEEATIDLELRDDDDGADESSQRRPRPRRGPGASVAGSDAPSMTAAADLVQDVCVDPGEVAGVAAQQERSHQQTDQQSEAKVRFGLGPRRADGAQQARPRRRHHSREMLEKFKHAISPSYKRRNGEVSTTHKQRSSGSNGGSTGDDGDSLNQAACLGAADEAKAKAKVDATLFGSFAPAPHRNRSGIGGTSGPIVLQPRSCKAEERRNRA